MRSQRHALSSLWSLRLRRGLLGVATTGALIAPAGWAQSAPPVKLAAAARTATPGPVARTVAPSDAAVAPCERVLIAPPRLLMRDDPPRRSAMSKPHEPGFATLAIHAGASPDPTTGARVTPIYQTTAFVFNDVDHAASLFALEAFGNIYTRIGNPTQSVLEGRIAALEGGTAALAVASGHAAQMIVFHTLMGPGDAFVAGRQLYGGSVNQFNHAFKKFDWHVQWADATEPASFEAAITPKTKALFCESIANPGGVVIDLEAIGKIAKKHGLPFTLLADEDHSVAELYGTWVEKSMYGKKYMGIERSTFVIDAAGNVAKIMRRVKPSEHADNVLAALA